MTFQFANNFLKRNCSDPGSLYIRGYSVGWPKCSGPIILSKCFLQDWEQNCDVHKLKQDQLEVLISLTRLGDTLAHLHKPSLIGLKSDLFMGQRRIVELFHELFPLDSSN